MHILVVTQYFPPDMGAPAGRFHDFARHWISLGHRVTILTGLPHFPAGVIHEGYRRRIYLHERQGEIDVHRCWTLTSRRHFLGRALAYVSFLVSSCIFLLLARLDYDCVVATSPPPSVGLPGALAARLANAPLVFDVRDIWPESPKQSGRLRNPVVIRAFEAIANFLYRKAALITTVTEGWKRRLVELGVAPEKIRVLANGVDYEAFDEQSTTPLPRTFAALEPDARWFTYAGIFNTPQGIDVLLRAAARMRERAPDHYARSQFVMVGEGPKEVELRALADDLKLDRAVFIPRQPRSIVFALLRRSFAVLVTLRPRKDTSTVPSKLYECLASGRPVLFSAGGEGADLVRRADAGAVCAAGDAEALCEAMLELLRNPEEADRRGGRGRAYVVEHFDRRRIAESFAVELERLCRATRREA